MHFGSAPRRVPLSLQIINFFNGFSQMGWLFFGFGMVFCWIFVAEADFSFITFRGDHEIVNGRVTAVEKTHASENEVEVKANHYEYSVAGTLMTGTSYSTGERASVGDTVPIEYDRDNPVRSRIEGMRRATFGPGVAFVGFFPLIGLAMLIPATISGMKRNQLLRDVMFATGKLIAKRETNMRVNRRPVYELCFEFTSRDGRRCEAKARTSNTERLEDEAQEALLYDPNDPSRVFVLDEAPARPELDLNGELRGHPVRAFIFLLPPVIIISIHAWLLWLKLK